MGRMEYKQQSKQEIRAFSSNRVGRKILPGVDSSSNILFGRLNNPEVRYVISQCALYKWKFVCCFWVTYKLRNFVKGVKTPREGVSRIMNNFTPSQHPKKEERLQWCFLFILKTMGFPSGLNCPVRPQHLWASSFAVNTDSLWGFLSLRKKSELASSSFSHQPMDSENGSKPII